ncbi:MAG: hypothetical protein KatS3mg002_0695 [Candidatus Woesearchaeota archaeon]|nr:MAG: hypothetical protein KatS3mg002_0695 [Candidatus Woesearchaeota archaeon]
MPFEINHNDIAWCPGCGNFSIINIVKKALDELSLDPTKVVIVSGIGQAAKLPQYLNTNYFNGLHGRALPPATAIKASNPELTVIVTSGDGDMYGEGGNHFIHAIRRNPNITVIVHDNMIYGLTKGQASPTSLKGMKTPVQISGVILEPFNPLAVAISLDASFVARASVNDMEHAKEIVKKAITHKGFALVDILQPCVTFNKLNTYEWYNEHTYYLEKEFDPHNKGWAFSKALETEKMPLGILYIKDKEVFEESIGIYDEDKTPLYKRVIDKEKIKSIIGKKDKYPVRIINIKKETHDVYTIITEKPFSFIAGQYVMIGKGITINNKEYIPITIASAPEEDNLRFTIKDMGGYSRELINSKIGEILLISKPLGETYKIDTEENILMLSGGTGITPFISILRHVRNNNMKNRIILLNANCTYDDIIFREELDYLSRDNIYIMNTLEKYDSNWLGEKGRINKEMILKYVNKPEDYTWMICGPPGMVAEMEKIAKDLGVKNIRRDNWNLPGKCDITK